MVAAGIFSEAFAKFSESWGAAKKEYVQRIKEDEEFAARWGDLGPVYGSQWIHWPRFAPMTHDEPHWRKYYIKDPKGIDQIATVIQGMKKDVTSARHIVTAWNPDEVPEMALPPCHTLFQLNSDGERLDLQLYQRACDMFLGVPFNIASYAMLTTIFAKELGLQPGEFVHTFGDVHFYSGAGERAKWYRDNFKEFKQIVGEAETPEDFNNLLGQLNQTLPAEDAGREGMDHVTGILEQLTREPKSLPRVTIADKPYNRLTIDDFVLEGYDPASYIKRTLAV